jgi:hypothetical protein
MDQHPHDLAYATEEAKIGFTVGRGKVFASTRNIRTMRNEWGYRRDILRMTSREYEQRLNVEFHQPNTAHAWHKSKPRPALQQVETIT